MVFSIRESILLRSNPSKTSTKNLSVSRVPRSYYWTRPQNSDSGLEIEIRIPWLEYPWNTEECCFHEMILAFSWFFVLFSRKSCLWIHLLLIMIKLKLKIILCFWQVQLRASNTEVGAGTVAPIRPGQGRAKFLHKFSGRAGPLRKSSGRAVMKTIGSGRAGPIWKPSGRAGQVVLKFRIETTGLIFNSDMLQIRFSHEIKMKTKIVRQEFWND